MLPHWAKNRCRAREVSDDRSQEEEELVEAHEEREGDGEEMSPLLLQSFRVVVVDADGFADVLVVAAFLWPGRKLLPAGFGRRDLVELVHVIVL